MPGETFRQVLRRLIPRRLRWLARAAFRLATGSYLRNAIGHRQATQSALVEAQGEVMDLMLRRLRALEEQMVALAANLQTEVAALAPPLHRLEESQDALRSEILGRLAEMESRFRSLAPIAAKMQRPVSPEAALGEDEL